MAGPPKDTAGPVTVEPGPVTGKDYNIPPPVTDADLYRPPPPIENSPLPNPRILTKTAGDTAGGTARQARQISLKAARKGDPEPWVIGRCLAEPQLVAADDAGDYLLMDLLWSRGPIDYFEGFVVDGVFEGRADFLGNVQHFDGESTQAVSSLMEDAKGTYDQLPNRAHSVARWRNTWSLQIYGRIRGMLFTDPRESPNLVYSTNPAIALAAVLVACGYTMNWDSVATAADYCDELIGSPGEKRWEIGGQILGRADHKSWITTLATCASCFVDRIGDEVYLIPDCPRSSNHTVSADDMIEETVQVTHAGGKNVPSSVTCIGKTVDGEPIQYTYGTSDGAGTDTTLQLPFFQSISELGRKAEETWRKARSDMTLEFVGFDSGILRTVGDVGTITNAQFGLSAVEMALIETRPVGRGRWYKKYSLYDAANYSNVIYSSSSVVTSLDNPYRPPAGPQPAAYEYTFTDGAGNTYQRFEITFTGQSWAYIRDYWVVVEHDGLPVMQTFVDHIARSGSPLAEQTHTLYTDFPLIAAEAYNIKVYIRSNTLALSEDPGELWITALSVFANYYEEDRGGAHISWVNPEYILLDNGVDFTTPVWEYDEENETHYLQVYEHPASPNIPNDAVIDFIRLDIRAWKSSDVSVVNLKGVRIYAGNTSPAVAGDVQTSQAVTTTAAVYTFEGDLTYWDLTSAQAQQLFDGSNDGWIQIIGEVVDTLAIPSPGSLTLSIDWAKLSVTFTPA
jgi:hypothetical protein